jgi:peptidylprolyl isomerase
VNNSTTSPRRRPRALPALAALATAGLLAGCGSSNTSTITVGNENTSDNSLASAGSTAAKTTETASAKTPTSGPLSKEPKVTPPSGPPPTVLIKKDLIVGTGPEAKPGQNVTVNYVGVLYKGGKEFDASWKRNEPFTFVLGKGAVIAGWDQGIAGMKVGGRRELIIPASLAYGSRGAGASIPPNSALVFVVDLLGT